MFYEWKDIKGRKKEEKDRIPIFIFFYLFIYFFLFIYFYFILFYFFLFSQMNLLSYILCYFMLAYRVKAIIIYIYIYGYALLSYDIPFTGKHEPNELTCSPLCDFIAQLVRALHRHRRGHGFESR